MRIQGAAVLEPASSIRKVNVGVDSGGMGKKCVSASHSRTESIQAGKPNQTGIAHSPEAIKNTAPILQNDIVRLVHDIPLALAACFDPESLSFI